MRSIIALLLLLSPACWGVQSLPAGQLRTIGEYPTWRIGHTIAPVGQGRYLVHGAQPLTYAPGKPSDNPVLRERRHASQGAQIERDAWLWLPERKGWKRLPAQPECPINAYLQAITPLSDGDVLLSGGLCDPPRLADDLSPTPAFTATSRLNGKTLQWENSPPLHTARLFHTATQLGDGSVLVVGGEMDPAVSPAPYPVLASVERLHNGRFESLAPLAQARANHTATLLDKHSLLIIGGFDALGEALASVELWDAQQARWLQLPPLTQARYAHSATLLSDGRILVAGGFDRQGRALNSTEYFDPQARRWQSGPSLPAPVGRHRAVRMSDDAILLSGEITPIPPEVDSLAYLLPAGAQNWQLAARLPPDSEGLPLSGPLIQPLAAGKALIFGKRYIWQWQDISRQSEPASASPKWRGSPTLLRLSERQFMLIAASASDQQSPRQAWIGDIETGQWQSGGRLKNAHPGPGRAIRLPHGQILFLAHGPDNTLRCELSPMPPAATSEWHDCGKLKAEFVLEAGLVLASHGDGRIIALPNLHEAFVFDPGSQAWERGTLTWHTEKQAYGTPVRSDAPLSELQLPGKGVTAGEILDVSPAAARLWGYLGARVDHAVVIDGKISREVTGRGQPPALLWNPEKAYWDYVFPDHSNIGRDALYLPDGCALSLQPTSLFDPKTGKAGRLTPPGGLNENNNSSIVFGDGTLVIASAEKGSGEGMLLIRQASCNGLSGADDSPEMPGILLPEQAAITPPAPLSPAAPLTTDQGPEGISARIKAFLHALPRFKDLPGISQGALALVILLALLRWGLLPHLQSRANHAGGGDTKTQASPPSVTENKLGNLLTQSVSPLTRRILRVIFYSLAAVVVGPALIGYLAFSRMQAGQACQESVRACLDSKTGLLKSVPQLRGSPSNPRDSAHIPCRFVGNWSSRQDWQIRRIVLKDDGTYEMAPLVQGSDRQNGYRGYWMAQAGHLVWRDSNNVGELDINPIAEEGDGWFVLIEGNGKRTRFERIEAHGSNRCMPD